jgi:cytochrome c oxidase assembly protein subunit 15
MPDHAPGAWAHRLAVSTLLTTGVLIVAGGLVTNTGSALAVPDWPTTFGYNMFLFPWSAMVGGVLFEHSHRLLGSLVGALTLVLAVVLWRTDGRGWVRGLGGLAVGLVCVQGLLGGLRVVLRVDVLGIVHGCLAQAFVAVLAALATVTAPSWRPVRGDGPAAPDSWGFAWLALGFGGAVYGQIVLGALTTHAGFVLSHVIGALPVLATGALLAGRVLRDRGAVARLRPPVTTLVGLLALQLALGVGAYLVRFTGLAVPGGEVLVVGFPVAHRVTGAMILALAVVLAVRAWPLAAPDREPPLAAPGGAVSDEVPA